VAFNIGIHWARRHLEGIQGYCLKPFPSTNSRKIVETHKIAFQFAVPKRPLPVPDRSPFVLDLMPTTRFLGLLVQARAENLLKERQIYHLRTFQSKDFSEIVEINNLTFKEFCKHYNRKVAFHNSFFQTKAKFLLALAFPVVFFFFYNSYSIY
jgi:hypothetical protein